jgi:hypothetical protein
MTMKKILMAAVAVSALTAGAANAATISNLSTIAAKPLTPGGGSTLTVNPYTLASELVVTPTTPAAAAVLQITPTASSVAAGNYVITYNITGGTFATTGVDVTDLNIVDATYATNVVTSVNTVSTTSISFNINVPAAKFLPYAIFTNAIKPGVAKSDVFISGSITTAEGANVDGGAITAKKVIDYRPAFVLDGVAADKTLSIASGFEEFLAGGAAANIGTAIGFAINDGLDAADFVYIDTAGLRAETTDLTAAVLTLTGDVSAFDATVNVTTEADADTANVFTLDATDLLTLQGQTLAVGLAQQTVPVPGNASDYSLGVEVEMAVGYTAPTFAALPLGSVALEGTNFFAAWVGDGTNGINYSIRLGNRTATAVTGVSVALLNSLNETTETTCVVGTLPASGELLITSASLNACFGNFGRADLRITVQASDTGVTAKMRSVSAGVVNEQSLGGGNTTAQAD